MDPLAHLQPRWSWLDVDRRHRLRTAHLLPPDTAPPRGAIIVLPGRSEFIEKYEDVFQDLLDRGLEIFTLDWRGQGLSSRMAQDRRKGHIDSYHTFIADLHAFMTQRVIPAAARPLTLLAHSMGAHIALRYLAERPDTPIARAVLNAPLVDVYASPTLKRTLTLTARALCALGRAEAWLYGARSIDQEHPFKGNALTSDPERYARTNALLRAQPDLYIGGFTAGWACATLDSARTLNRPEYLRRIATPTLITLPQNDTRVDNDATRRAVAWITDVTLREIPNARHELLFERQELRDAFWSIFDAFVGTQKT